MIDYVKLRAKDTALAKRLLANDLLTFTDLLNKERQKVGLIAAFNNLTFKIYESGFVEIEGSLHKFWNACLNQAGSQNWNDFRRLDLYDTIHELTRLFGFDPEAVTVHNLEFGVNITLPPNLNTENVLRRLLTYKKHKFNEQSIDGPGYFVEAQTDDFYVKAYDKGTQNDRTEPILRFEVKAVRMKVINRPGKPAVVTTLADLMNAARLDQLGAMLLTTFDRCKLAEPLDPDQLTPTERETALRSRNPNTWATLNKSQRNRLSKEYDRLTTRAVPADKILKPLLRGLITDKWQALLNTTGDVLRRGECDVLRLGGAQPFTRSSIAVERCIDVPSTTPVTQPSICPVMSVNSPDESESCLQYLVADNTPHQKPKPCSSAIEFHAWQRQHRYFGQMGLAGLSPDSRQKLLNN